MKTKSFILILLTILALSKTAVFAEGFYLKKIDKNTGSKDMEVTLNWVESKLSMALNFEADLEDQKQWLTASEGPFVSVEIKVTDSDDFVSDNLKVKNIKDNIIPFKFGPIIYMDDVHLTRISSVFSEQEEQEYPHPLHAEVKATDTDNIILINAEVKNLNNNNISFNLSQVLLTGAGESYKPFAYSNYGKPVSSKRDVTFELLPGESRTYNFYYFINQKYNNFNFNFKNLTPVQLKRIPDPRSIKQRLDELKSESAEVRAEAVKALGIIKNPATLKSLIKALNDKNPTVRRKTVMALGEIKDIRALDPLISVVRDTASAARFEAVRALGCFKNPKAVDALIEVLKEDWTGNSLAAEILGETGDPKAVAPLIETLARKHDPRNLKFVSSKALDKIEPNWRDREDAKKISLEYVTALRNDDLHKQIWAAMQLAQFRDIRAIPDLIKLLSNKNDMARREASAVLGEFKSKDAIQILKNLSKNDKDSDIRSAALKALEKILNKTDLNSELDIISNTNQ